MKELYVVRRYELGLLIIITVGYLLNSLLYDASRFEDKIRAAGENGVSVHTILQDLVHYDHTWNHNMPLIVASVMIFIAWYLFHYLLFPKFREEKFSAFELTILILTSGLVLSGTFILLNTISVEVRRNIMEQIIGLKDVTHFRMKFVLSDSIAIFTLFCLYEILSQLYYKLYEKLEIEPNGRILNYIVAFLICGLAFTIIMSQRLVPNILISIGIRQLLALVLFGLTVFCLQEYYFRKVYRIFHNHQLSTISYLPFLIYLLILGLGTGLITAILLRFIYISLPAQVLLITGLYICSITVAYYRRSQQKEKVELVTRITNKSAELANLRSQINPHFLFNTLNSLYATALSENSEKTADGIQKLGDMMRFMLHENNHDRIPLSSEISYLYNYIGIQRMRLDESQNIEIKVNLQEPGEEISIAPMLLNPFIENAFKHGISLRNPSWIFITLTLDSEKIYFKVHNSRHPLSGIDPEEKNGGIGLGNVEKRLRLIYPGRYSLQIQKSSQDYFVALTIDY